LFGIVHCLSASVAAVAAGAVVLIGADGLGLLHAAIPAIPSEAMTTQVDDSLFIMGSCQVS
jgi:hypothetical protein